MIRHLRHGEIDKAEWDRRLDRCANKLWYAQSWVLDMASAGWEGLVDDATDAIMPLTWRRKFGMDYLFQPYGLQQLGVFSEHEGDVAQNARFIKSIPARFKYVDICLNGAMSEITGGRPMTNNVLSLAATHDQLRSAYSHNHLRNLKRPLLDDVEWTTGLSASSFVVLFSRTTARTHGGLHQADRKILQVLIDQAMQRGQARVIGLVRKNELFAAACFLHWGGRTILFKSANTVEGMAMNAMFHIVDRHISDNAGVQQLLDFAGSNHPGTARFNEGFGAQRTRYVRLLANRLPPLIRWLKPRSDGG